MNKGGNNYKIKKMGNHTEGEVNDHTTLCTTEQCKCSAISAAVINCQSIKSRKALLNSFINTYAPSIVFGTESWLSPSLYSSEIFPHNYNIYTERIGMMDMVVFSWSVAIGILVKKLQLNLSDCYCRTGWIKQLNIMCSL